MLAVWMKVAAQFFRVFVASGHDVSWMEGRWDAPARQGRFLIYVTTDEKVVDRAKAALEAAGVLCHIVLDGSRVFSP